MMFRQTSVRMKAPRYWLAAIFLTIANLLQSEVAVAQVSIRTVAIKGQAVPGLDSAIHFDTFEPPWINADGQVAFFAQLAGPGVQFGNEGAIFSEAGGLHLIARKADHAPGAESGTTFGSLDLFPQLNSAGHILFSADLAGPGITYGPRSGGLWSDRSGSVQIVVRSGDPPLTFAAPSYSVGFVAKQINDHDQIGFETFSSIDYTTFGTTQADIWLSDTGNTSKVAGLSITSPTGHGFLKVRETLGLGPNGHLAFIASSTAPSPEAIWIAKDGVITLLASIDDPSLGIPPGELRGRSNVNAIGQLAFSSNDKLWIGSNSNDLHLIARGGDPTPGPVAGQTLHPDLAFFLSSLSINDQGQIAYEAIVQSPAHPFGAAIFSQGGGKFHWVAQQGLQVPGLPDGILFGDLDRTTLILNNSGNVAFVSTLAGAAGGVGIFAESGGALHAVVRTGDLLQTSPGVFKTVADTGFVGHFGNKVSGAGKFNDAGQLAFWARFTDGAEGLFVATVVPELPAAPLALTAFPAVLCLRRRRAPRTSCA